MFVAEQEQDEMIERMRKEKEQRKKREEEEALTLEQTKEQVI
jgi:G protein pathway suppressor 2